MTSKVLKHKGFLGSVEFDLAAEILHGKILYINDLVDYNADSVAEIKVEFEAAVDDYLALCEELGDEPQKSASGTFNVRIEPLMHFQLLQESAIAGISLNMFLKSIVSKHITESKEKSVDHFDDEEQSVANGSYTGQISLQTLANSRPSLRVVK